MKSSCEFSFEADGRCRATISAANREEFVGYLVRLMLSALSDSPPGSSNAAAAASRSPVAADVSDTDAITISQAAIALGLSRSTASRWVKLGYEAEFGNRTTLTHLRRWLREEYGPRYRDEKRKKKAALIEAVDKRYNELFSPEAERRRQERIARNRKQGAAKRKKTS